MIFNVENMKCGGCTNMIQSKIKSLDGVTEVMIDVEQGIVDVTTTSQSEPLRVLLSQTLHDMGYPEKGQLAGFGSVKAKAKSFVSCAVGRLKD